MGKIEKLKLKELSPYLPYGLKIYCKYSNMKHFAIWELSVKNIDMVVTYDSRKPILYPLSEYTTYPEIMMEFSEYSEQEFINSFLLEISPKNRFDHISYRIAQKMFECHLDLFGLIDKGLAINCNTI